jgi:ferredoxin
MGGLGTGGGRGGGRYQGSGGRGIGQGMCQRHRDGSGRGAGLDPSRGASITSCVTAAVITPQTVADVPVGAPAVAFRARPVAIAAKPGSCIACGTCVDSCLRGAITLQETAVIDAQLCNGCGLCVNDCSYGALAFAEA